MPFFFTQGYLMGLFVLKYSGQGCELATHLCLREVPSIRPEETSGLCYPRWLQRWSPKMPFTVRFNRMISTHSFWGEFPSLNCGIYWGNWENIFVCPWTQPQLVVDKRTKCKASKIRYVLMLSLYHNCSQSVVPGRGTSTFVREGNSWAPPQTTEP